MIGVCGMIAGAVGVALGFGLGLLFGVRLGRKEVELLFGEAARRCTHE